MSRQTTPNERVKFWRDPALQGLEMLHATYITYAFSRHALVGFGIAIVEAGAMKFDYRGASHIAPAGSVVITHPGEMHTGQAVLDTGWTYRTILPAIEWLQQAATGLSERSEQTPYFPSPVTHDSRLNQQLVKLHRILEQSSSPLERESRFTWEMAQLIHQHARERPQIKPIGQENRAMEQARDFLTSYYTRNISLKELADLVDLKPFRLLRAFKKQFGLPPHAYLNHVRVHQAKRLLARGYSISDTALATGFADQSHLHRHFKKMLGVTPGQYAKGCRW